MPSIRMIFHSIKYVIYDQNHYLYPLFGNILFGQYLILNSTEIDTTSFHVVAAVIMVTVSVPVLIITFALARKYFKLALHPAARVFARTGSADLLAVARP